MKKNVVNRKETIKLLKQEVKFLIKKHNICVSKEKFSSSIGRAWTQDGKDMIKIPPLTTLSNIYVALHEIGHILKDHFHKKEYLQEYEAEKYALKKLKEFNVHINFPKDYEKIERDAKLYVFSYMLKEECKLENRTINWVVGHLL